MLLRFVFDGLVGDEEREDMQVIGSQVVSDFPCVVLIREEILRVDAPARLDPYVLCECAYWRKEAPPPVSQGDHDAA